jgi:membrane protease subunit HflC
MNRLIALGVVAIGLFYVFVSSIYVVNEREQAIVTRFGQIIDVKTEPGMYFKVPTNVVDNVQIIEDRLLRADVSNMSLQVSDGKFYIVDAFLSYRISDPRLFRTRAQGEIRVAEDRLTTRLNSALRDVYSRRDFTAALSDQRSAMMNEARDIIRPDMSPLGIDVVDVRILRTDLDPNVSADTFNRMKAERLAEAALLRARGQEAKRTATAIADRQRTEIIAAAQRDAEILRGEGEAERSGIFAEAYTRDPDFFQFYRSMQSYRAALGGTGTTMVLSPNSEFFRYFENENPDNIQVAPGAGADIPVTPLIETPAESSPILDTPAAPADATTVTETAPAATPAVETAPAAPATSP